MQIKCDNCGAVFDQDDAVVHEPDDGEPLYFCSDECMETADLTVMEEDEAEPAGASDPEDD
jgi:hypothetical protein